MFRQGEWIILYKNDTSVEFITENNAGRIVSKCLTSFPDTGFCSWNLSAFQ